MYPNTIKSGLLSFNYGIFRRFQASVTAVVETQMQIELC